MGVSWGQVATIALGILAAAALLTVLGRVL